MIAASARGLALNLDLIPLGSTPRSAAVYWSTHRSAGLIFCLFLCLCAAVARAEVKPSTIVLAFDASSAAQKAAIAAIRAHVQDLPLTVELAAVEPGRSLELRLAASGELAAARRALGTFYIDVAGDRSLLIFFTEAHGEATLIRRLPPNPRGWRVALEQAAIVARSLVEALLEGGSVGIGPPAEASAPVASAQPGRTGAAPQVNAPPPQPEPPATTRPSDAAGSLPSRPGAHDRRLAMTAGALVTSFAEQVPWQSGLSLGLHGRVASDLFVGLRYTVLPALTIGNSDADFSLQRHPIELSLGFREGGRLALTGEASLMVDRTTRRTLRTSPSFDPLPSSSRWLGVIGGQVGFSWSPWDPISFALRVGAEMLLTPYSYSIDSGQPLPAPRWVRPRVELEVLLWVW